eukprot:tig00000241_g20877.t1
MAGHVDAFLALKRAGATQLPRIGTANFVLPPAPDPAQKHVPALARKGMGRVASNKDVSGDEMGPGHGLTRQHSTPSPDMLGRQSPTKRPPHPRRASGHESPDAAGLRRQRSFDAGMLRLPKRDISSLQDRPGHGLISRTPPPGLPGPAVLEGSGSEEEEDSGGEGASGPEGEAVAAVDLSVANWIQRAMGAFDKRVPANRRDVMLLENWMREQLSRVELIGDDERLAQQAHAVYSACMAEIAKQVGVQCVERGALLESVWKNYTEMVSRTQGAQLERVRRGAAAEVAAMQAAHRTEMAQTRARYEQELADLRERDGERIRDLEHMARDLQTAAASRAARIEALQGELERTRQELEQASADKRWLESENGELKARFDAENEEVDAQATISVAERRERALLEERLGAAGRELAAARVELRRQERHAGAVRERAVEAVTALQAQAARSRDELAELKNRSAHERLVLARAVREMVEAAERGLKRPDAKKKWAAGRAKVAEVLGLQLPTAAARAGAQTTNRPDFAAESSRSMLVPAESSRTLRAGLESARSTATGLGQDDASTERTTAPSTGRRLAKAKSGRWGPAGKSPSKATVTSAGEPEKEEATSRSRTPEPGAEGGEREREREEGTPSLASASMARTASSVGGFGFGASPSFAVSVSEGLPPVPPTPGSDAPSGSLAATPAPGASAPPSPTRGPDRSDMAVEALMAALGQRAAPRGGPFRSPVRTLHEHLEPPPPLGAPLPPPSGAATPPSAPTPTVDGVPIAAAPPDSAASGAAGPAALEAGASYRSMASSRRGSQGAMWAPPPSSTAPSRPRPTRPTATPRPPTAPAPRPRPKPRAPGTAAGASRSGPPRRRRARGRGRGRGRAWGCPGRGAAGAGLGAGLRALLEAGLRGDGAVASAGRPRPKKATMKTIYAVYAEKLAADAVEDVSGRPRASLRDFLCDWLASTYTSRPLAQTALLDLLASLRPLARAGEERPRAFLRFLAARDAPASNPSPSPGGRSARGGVLPAPGAAAGAADTLALFLFGFQVALRAMPGRKLAPLLNAPDNASTVAVDTAHEIATSALPRLPSEARHRLADQIDALAGSTGRADLDAVLARVIDEYSLREAPRLTAAALAAFPEAAPLSPGRRRPAALPVAAFAELAGRLGVLPEGPPGEEAARRAFRFAAAALGERNEIGFEGTLLALRRLAYPWYPANNARLALAAAAAAPPPALAQPSFSVRHLPPASPSGVFLPPAAAPAGGPSLSRLPPGIAAPAPPVPIASPSLSGFRLSLPPDESVPLSLLLSSPPDAPPRPRPPPAHEEPLAAVPEEAPAAPSHFLTAAVFASREAAEAASDAEALAGAPGDDDEPLDD